MSSTSNRIHVSAFRNDKALLSVLRASLISLIKKSNVDKKKNHVKAPCQNGDELELDKYAACKELKSLFAEQTSASFQLISCLT